MYHGKPGLGSKLRPSIAKLDPEIGDLQLPNGDKVKDTDAPVLNSLLRGYGVDVSPHLGYEATARAYAAYLHTIGMQGYEANVLRWQHRVMAEVRKREAQ